LITHPQPPPRRGLFLKVWSLIKRNHKPKALVSEANTMELLFLRRKRKSLGRDVMNFFTLLCDLKVNLVEWAFRGNFADK